MDLIIDADSHVTEAPDLWTSRVPHKHVDDVPHVVRDDQGRDIWVLGGVKISTVGNLAVAGWEGFPPSPPPTFADCHPGAHDAAARLRYLDEAGIWAQALYPNVAGFGSQRFLRIPDDKLKLWCVRAYNDFLHEWASADPERLIPICSTPFWDVAAAVAEVERCVDLGFRGLLFTGEPLRFGLPTIGSHHWDPLWSVASEAGLPIHFHIGGGEDTVDTSIAERARDHPRQGAIAQAGVGLHLKNGMQCADLITSGVLSRFPHLRFVSVESGIGWIPFMLESVDYSWLGASKAGRSRDPDELLPSELFRRQVYCTYWFERVAPNHLIQSIPVDNILFETDFPHQACLYGNIRETIENGLGEAPPEVRRKFLWDNAARLYNINQPPETSHW